MAEKIIKTENCFCYCCMQEHTVKTVLMDKELPYKNINVQYKGVYFYCDKADTYFSDSTQMRANDLSLKDAYRKQVGLLSSEDIIQIRERYCISQKDLCTLLGWGKKTITRYETCQVQDTAHDSILRKIDSDPAWFLELLQNKKDSFSKRSYEKSLNAASSLFSKSKESIFQKLLSSENIMKDNKEILNVIEIEEAKTDFLNIAEKVCNSHEVVLVRNANTGKNVVILSEEDWNSIKETLYIESIPGLVDSILEAEKEQPSERIAYDPKEAW